MAAAPVAEESESEIEVKPEYQEEMVTIPVKLTTIEKAASRRKSAKVELPETDESGFSDFNPFQSGGEESKERKVRRKVRPFFVDLRPVLSADLDIRSSRLWASPHPSDASPNSLGLGPWRTRRPNPPRPLPLLVGLPVESPSPPVY